MQNKITNIIGIILAFIACISIVISLADYEKEIDQQNNQIKSLEEELIEIKDDNEFYRKQYKKYLELSEELQNQMGVYAYD